MITGMTSVVVLSTQLAVGGLGLFDCLKKDRHAYRGAECCHSCVSEYTTVGNLLAVLDHHASPKQRQKAAQALRKYDWRCHPEVVPVLASALLNVCEAKVRRAVAETLAKFEPCDPTARVALRQAAIGDPDLWTRKRSRKAVDRIGRGCGPSCDFCGPAVIEGPAIVGAPIPMPVEYEVEALPPPSRAPRIYGEVPYDRVAPLYERRRPAIPPQGFDDPYPYRPGSPAMPGPSARPELLPAPIDPIERPIEVIPPELPLPDPPSASPFGASRTTDDPPKAPARNPGAVRIFTIGRPR